MTRAAGWEVFFLTKRPPERRRLRAVPDPVVDRALRVLSAGRVDGAGLAGRDRERVAARPARRRSADQLRRGGERLDRQGGVDAAIARLRQRATTPSTGASAWCSTLSEAVTVLERLNDVLPAEARAACSGWPTGSRRRQGRRRCRKIRGRFVRSPRSSPSAARRIRGECCSVALDIHDQIDESRMRRNCA